MSQLKLNMSSVSRCSESTDTTKTAILNIITGFEISSGKRVEAQRIKAMTESLIASDWTSIWYEPALKHCTEGAPARFGNITLADFRPNKEQMAEVGFDLNAALEARYRQGKKDGFNEGHSAAWAEFRRDRADLARLPVSDLAYRTKLIEGREKAFEQDMAELALLRIEVNTLKRRHLGRLLDEAGQQASTV